MAEPSTPCRWGAMSVLMRLKNKIKEKVFWYRILNEPSSPDASESDPSNWTDSQHFDNEGSTSNHPDLQHYFDAPQGFQNPSSQFANLGQNGGLFSQMLHGEGMMLDPLDGSGTSHEQEAFMTLADFDTEDRQQQWTAQMYHRYTTSQYGMAEEYIDARAEMLDDQSSLEHSYSAPPQLGHLLSTVETAEMMDTGDSSNLGPVRQTSAVEWQRILFLQQFLGVDGAVRAGPGWKVVLGIVSAFKRLSGLIRRRRQEKTAEVRVEFSSTSKLHFHCTSYSSDSCFILFSLVFEENRNRFLIREVMFLWISHMHLLI